MMKPWQRGIELAVLQRYAAVFKARHKALVHGAFGLTKERDVATAMAENRLAWTQGSLGDLPQACAITNRLRSNSTHRDFAKRELRIASGSIVVSSFACLDAAAGHRLLRGIEVRARARVYVEAFEEDELAREALERVGFGYCMTKIAAGSEVKGMYCSAGDVLPELPRSESAALEVCAPDFATGDELVAALREIDAYEHAGPMWAQHYSSYNKRKSWTAIALRGFDANDPSFIISPREMAQSWKAANPERLISACEWTKAATEFPTVLKLVGRIGRDFERVRLMRLAGGGGELSRHADITDRLAGVADGRMARVHIPLVTNPGVRFKAWGIRGERIERHLPAGALCFLDQRKPHAVTNSQPEPRIHIVADAVSSPALRALLFGESP
jgi:hypothetical protein